MQSITPEFLRVLSLRADFPSTAKELVIFLAGSQRRFDCRLGRAGMARANGYWRGY